MFFESIYFGLILQVLFTALHFIAKWFEVIFKKNQTRVRFTFLKMDQINQLKNKIEFNEARFEAIAQTASDSIIISDENSKIVFANRKAYETFGYPKGSLIGSDLGILMPEKYRQGHRSGVQRFIATGIPKLIGHTIEIEGLRKDESIFPMELSLSSWKEDGSYFFSGIIRDITERKEAFREKEEANIKLQHQQEELEAANEELKAAEEELRTTNDDLEYRVEIRTRQLEESENKVKQSEEQLRLITNAVPVLISYLDSNIVYRFVNKTYEELFQVKSEEIIGKTVREVIGEKAFNNVKPLLERVLEGQHVESEAFQDYGKAGKRWVNISLMPHRVNNQIIGIFGLVEDITRFKNIQQELEELLLVVNKANEEKDRALKQLEEKNRELERINTDLDSFIYTASHDLKSPITNMEGLNSLLKESVYEKMEPKERMMFGMLDTSIQRLQKTIGDLVEITKIQKGLHGAVEELVRFDELSREVKGDLYSLIQTNNAIITENFEIKEIKYKKSGLRSILYNLLSNAIKFRNPDRQLEVELITYIKDDYVVLSVKDNGLGLSPNQQKKLFTLFKRMHQHVEGTGVGLFMVKRIVENNRGRIEVQSEEGKGTTFNVYLKE